MATDLARQPVGRDRPDPAERATDDTAVVDLVPLHLRPAEAALDAPGFLEVEVDAAPAPPPVAAVAPRSVVRGILVVLAALAIPALVVALAVRLPVDAAVQGVVVVVGWLALAAGVHRFETRPVGRRR